MRTRVTGRHGHATNSIVGELLEASRRPHDAFDILERVTRREPALERHLLRVANAAGRRGFIRITDVRAALVRLGLVTASRILLEAAHRAEPTRFDPRPAPVDRAA
ncbi:MAG TPA: HDOD domain-containing protein [Sandaracinaceae bacterium LLY-WYZ-13_1]|nr:HDOD domain-containing protein [Sandaracinaceae bacterium LLY-WYZ-13_1]